MLTEMWYENLKESDKLEDLDVDGRIMLKIYLKETGHEVIDWIHFISIGGLLSLRQ
jgi:hypothetical protein